MTINTVHNIKSVSLKEYHPNFLLDLREKKINWFEVPYVPSRIQTFLLHIAKITYKEFKCFCCVYPHKTTAGFTVFVDINNGEQFMLIVTIRDNHQYPDSGLRIEKLKRELLFLSADRVTLEEIADQLHLSESSHP